MKAFSRLFAPTVLAAAVSVAPIRAESIDDFVAQTGLSLQKDARIFIKDGSEEKTVTVPGYHNFSMNGTYKLYDTKDGAVFIPEEDTASYAAMIPKLEEQNNQVYVLRTSTFPKLQSAFNKEVYEHLVNGTARDPTLGDPLSLELKLPNGTKKDSVNHDGSSSLEYTTKKVDSVRIAVNGVFGSWSVVPTMPGSYVFQASSLANGNNSSVIEGKDIYDRAIKDSVVIFKKDPPVSLLYPAIRQAAKSYEGPLVDILGREAVKADRPTVRYLIPRK